MGRELSAYRLRIMIMPGRRPTSHVRLSVLGAVAGVALVACSGSSPNGVAPIAGTAFPTVSASATASSPDAGASSTAPATIGLGPSGSQGPVATKVVTGLAGAGPQVGRAVVVRAVVSPVSASVPGAPTGTMIFLVSGRAAGSAPLVASGSTAYADLSLKLTGGSYSVVARYSGDPAHSRADAPAFTLVIPTAASTIELTAKPLGTPGKLHIVIVVKAAKPAPVPGGTVLVSIDGGPAQQLTLSAGRAHVDHQFTYYKGGRHTVVVRYGGNGIAGPVSASFIVTT